MINIKSVPWLTKSRKFSVHGKILAIMKLAVNINAWYSLSVVAVLAG